MDEMIPARILIVDDEPLVRRTLADYLAGCGYEVAAAADGAEGLAKARAEQFDTVLVDLRMPRVDGLEVIGTLKAEQPDLPVVVVSGTGVLADAIAAMRRGAWDYISKPVQDMTEVTIVVERVLEKVYLRDRKARAEEALHRAYEALERRVEERTAELARANAALQAEIVERIRAEEGQRKALAKALQATEALRESEERLALALEAATDGLYDWNMQTGEAYFSPRYYTMLGYEPDEMPASYDTWIDLLHPDDRQHAIDIVNEHVEGKRDSHQVEFRMRAKPGGWRWILSRGRVIERDDDGRPIRMVGTHVDTTERKRVEEERARLLAQIQKQARQVQQIIETVPEGVLLLDADGRVVLANPLGENALDDLANVQVGDTLQTGSQQALTRLGDRPLDELLTSPPQGLWHEVKTDDLPPRTFEVIARPMEDGPETKGWVMVLRDMTQQREIQRSLQQQERLAAVGQLAAGIAHDFNNILATIVLYAQMSARAEELPNRIRERMRTINHQARHATELIQQILDFSRRAVLERCPMDLLLFLQEQVNLLERTLPENIEIDLAYDRGEYGIHADPTRVQQVIMNLAVNARDAMPEGGRLHLELDQVRIENGKRSPLPEMSAGEWVRLSVSDTGIGIPPDVLPHIFDPFFTTKAVGKGTGLGLAQVWGIVKQHDGHVDVVTEVGEGTTFILYLPVLQTTQPGVPTQDEAALPDGHGETILVVEDDTRVRNVLTQTLETLNYRVLSAANGREALSVFEQSKEIALVLTDMVMPEMGGVALSHALKEKGWTGPVVVLTGHPLDGVNKADTSLQSAGVVKWLQKPVDLEQLTQTLAQTLGS